jgi:hypothetical protein
MNCPRCGQAWCCPCASCRARGEEGDSPWIREGKENEKCPKCGLSKSLSWWGELECEIYLDKPKIGIEEKTMSNGMTKETTSSTLIEVKCRRNVFKSQIEGKSGGTCSDKDDCLVRIIVSSFINPAFVTTVSLGFNDIESAVIRLRDGTTFEVSNEEAHNFLKRMDYLCGDK